MNTKDRLIYNREYYLNKKQEVLEQKKEYYLENREEILKKQAKYKKQFPWKRLLKNIKQRCNNPNIPIYKYYGGRGIKCLITVEELKELWFRDKAEVMNRPSIDRIDNNGHYIFENCRFIELSENSRKAHLIKKGENNGKTS